MIDLIISHQKYLENLPLIFNYNSLKIEITSKLNKDKLVVISWLRWSPKTNIVSNIIKKSNYKNNYFYFNKDLDYNNEIKSENDLNLLFSSYTKRYKNPNIIILENTHNIKWFKDFLSKKYSEKKYKLIIIWNDIKIWWKPKIYINTLAIKQIKELIIHKFNLTDLLNYGSLEEVFLLNNAYLKNRYLELQKSDIIYNDIIKTYSLKNYDLYEYTLSFLSLLKDYTSLRELNKSLNKHIKLSLVTMIEYVEYSIEANIISKMQVYDIKLQKEITSKAKYYFSDLWIRNSLNWFNTSLHTLKENLIYNELVKIWYKVNGWLNGKFEFSFIGKKSSIPLSQPFPQREKGVAAEEKIKIDTLFIHISKQTKSEEIKKEVRKLLKIPFIPTQIDWKNSEENVWIYLIVENIKELKLKKLKYENVKIVDFEEFVTKTLA